jgi:DNA-binding transcriptional ArsR family regulator
MNTTLEHTEFAAYRKLGQVIFCVIVGSDTVGKLTGAIGTRHSTIMEHLGKLEGLGILASVKKGRERIYRINWDRLIDVFASLLIDYERFMLEGKDTFPGRHTKASLLQQQKEGGEILYRPEGIEVRLGHDRAHAERLVKFIPSAERILKENKIARDFIRKYLETYAQLYWTEDDFSLQGSVRNFEDRFALLADQDEKVASLLQSKCKNKEVSDFIRFLNHLATSYILEPNQHACLYQMQQFLTGIAPSISTKRYSRRSSVSSDRLLC